MDQNRNEQETGQPKLPFYKKRSFKYGSMATAFTAVFIAIVVLLNVGLSVLSARTPLSVDLTKSHDYGISSATVSYLKTVKTPITIKVFATKSQMESSQYMPAMRVIEQYPKYDSGISIDYIDYDKNPTAAAEYQSENIQQGDIVVDAKAGGKDRYKYLNTYSDIMITNTDSSSGQTTVLGNQAEQQIDNALDYVTSQSLPVVQFTTGHNEQSSDLQSLLTGNNYQAKSVNTATGSLDASAQAVAVVNPQVDFSAAEVAKLDAFLKNGGKFGKTAFILLDPRYNNLPNLEEYCSEWGIKVGTGLLYDKANSLDNLLTNIACTNVNTDVTGTVPAGVATDVSVARPLTLLFDTRDVRTAKAVITTPNTTQLHASVSGAASDSDPKAAYTVMALSTWSQSSTTTGSLQKSNLVVSGSAEMASSSIVQQSNKNNARVLAGVANKLMNRTAAVTVESKYASSSTVTLTAAARNIVIVVFLVLLPLALLIVGAAIYLRRRHL